MATQVGGELLSYGLHGQHCRWPQTEGLQTKVGARSLRLRTADLSGGSDLDLL
jgi:hypothetical protein